jgi:threonine 3-dehydrogenase
MKALSKQKPQKGLELIDVEIPYVDIDDVLIEVIQTSICGTDAHIYKWDKWSQETIKTPLIIGHEFVGKVFALGKNVKNFEKGEIVSGEGHIVCGKCRNCNAGNKHICQSTKGVGIHRQGAFANFVCIPASNVIKVKPGIPLDFASCFDPLGNAVHTALQYDLVGEDVLITGAGPIGCMATAVARMAGARKIVVTDVNASRLNIAKRMGADATIDPFYERIEDYMSALGIVEGFDVGFEMSGDGQALGDQIKYTRNGANIAVLGIFGHDPSIDINKIVFKMLNVRGIYGRHMYETWHKMQALIQIGLDISPVITHKFHYTQYEEAFECMISGESGKIILDWSK